MHAGIVTCVLFISLAAVAICDDHGENAVSYKKDTFDADNAKGKLFVMFFAPWCGHCKRLAPTWDELAKEYNNVEGKQLTIGKVDCTIETDLCASHGVRGYPTVKLFNVNDKEGVKYAGKRTIEELTSYIEDQMTGGAEKADKKVEAKKEVPAPVATEGLYVLTDDDFANHIAKGHHFVKFYAPWCGHCKSLAPVWDQLAAEMKASEVKIAKVDCTQHQQTCSKYQVRGYPTLMWFTDGEKTEDYRSQRTIAELKKFAERLSSNKPEPAKLSKDGTVPDPLLDDTESGVVALTDEDFEETVSEDFTFVSFADDDQESFLRTLIIIAEQFADAPEFLVATVNCEENKATCDAQTKSANGEQQPLPLSKMYFNGAVIDTYAKDKNVNAISTFITEIMKKYGDEHDEL